MNLIDLFILMPFKKKIDKNHSSDIYEALSKRQSYSLENIFEEESKLSLMINHLFKKLDEKFGSFSEAFLWFDSSHLGQLRFSDF
jgi:hypothetical protein